MKRVLSTIMGIMMLVVMIGFCGIDANAATRKVKPTITVTMYDENQNVIDWDSYGKKPIILGLGSDEDSMTCRMIDALQDLKNSGFDFEVMFFMDVSALRQGGMEWVNNPADHPDFKFYDAYAPNCYEFGKACDDIFQSPNIMVMNENHEVFYFTGGMEVEALKKALADASSTYSLPDDVEVDPWDKTVEVGQEFTITLKPTSNKAILPEIRWSLRNDGRLKVVSQSQDHNEARITVKAVRKGDSWVRGYEYRDSEIEDYCDVHIVDHIDPNAPQPSNQDPTPSDQQPSNPDPAPSNEQPSNPDPAPGNQQPSNPDPAPGNQQPSDPTPSQPQPGQTVEDDYWNGFYTINGKDYWYEEGVRQGTVYDAKGVWYEGSNRGREIYDPNTDGWYWLDSVYDGAKAVGKEVFMPYIYQTEKDMDDTQIRNNANASDQGMQDYVYNCMKNGTGKWVRYDEEGKMLKGWVRIEGTLARIYPDQAGNTYYYDNQTGLMAKGHLTIDGRECYFDEVTGVLQ